MNDVKWVSHEEAQAIKARNEQIQAWLAEQPIPTMDSWGLVSKVWQDPRLQLTNKAFELEQERQRQRKRQRQLQQVQQRQRSTGPSL